MTLAVNEHLPVLFGSLVRHYPALDLPLSLGEVSVYRVLHEPPESPVDNPVCVEKDKDCDGSSSCEVETSPMPTLWDFIGWSVHRKSTLKLIPSPSP